jgi:hypothetical protein
MTHFTDGVARVSLFKVVQSRHIWFVLENDKLFCRMAIINQNWCGSVRKLPCDKSVYFEISFYGRYSDWLRAGRPRGRSSSPDKVKNFLHVVQTGSGVHPTSYPMGTGGSSPAIKWPGREADHSSPASTEVKIMWIYTYTPPYAFMAQCLIS